MTDFLEQVIAERRADVANAKAHVSAEDLRTSGKRTTRTSDVFETAIRMSPGRLAVIAEVKRRSPAAGQLREAVDVATLAQAYAAAGASAISVLTEPRHWGGSLHDLVAVREAVDIPVLCKDVIVDEYQLAEARAAGADAVLLIAEALDDFLLSRLLSRAHDLGLGVLLEAHEPVAFGRAVASGAAIVGVNARDLRRPGQTDVGRVRQLHTFVRPEQLLVAESGITSVDEARLLPSRVNAVLVGTALMRADDPAPLIRGLAGVRRTVHA